MRSEHVSCEPAFAERAGPATYRRRRVLAVLLLVTLLAGGALAADGLLGDPGGVPASAAGVAPAAPRRTTVARPGDTLWAIAHARHGDVDVRRYLARLIELNGGTRIEAGQMVVLP